MKEITVTVIKYQASDGKIFDKKDDCIFHEKILTGKIIKCVHCGGTGKIDAFGDGREYWECNDCRGNGYIMK
jgi:hypothetical protein